MLTATGPFGMRALTIENAKGHPDNPVSDAELRHKFAHNAGLAGITPERTARLADQIWSIDEAADASTLLRKLVAARSPAAVRVTLRHALEGGGLRAVRVGDDGRIDRCVLHAVGVGVLRAISSSCVVR